MSRTARAALLVGAVATLALGGCHSGVAAAPSAPRASVTSADPLGSVETTLDHIERQVDRDGAG